MKTSHPVRLVAAAAAVAVAAGMTSCSTYYDAYGYPHQAVDPALAVAGIAAAGLIGYAIADSNDDHHGHGGRYRRHDSYYGRHGGYYGHGSYYGGHGGYYDGYGGYCR